VNSVVFTGRISVVDETIIWRLAQAEDHVSRLDERVRTLSFQRGWTARLDVLEAVAWGWNSGRVVSLEDLLLHDEHMDVRLPHQDVRAAHGVIRARRKAMSGADELLSPDGVAWLLGRRRSPPARRPPAVGRSLDAEAPLAPQLVTVLETLQRGATEDPGEAVAEWLELLWIADARLPPLLQAAVALEGWRIVNPYPRETYAGPLLVAHWLRLRRRVRTHLLGLQAGLREVRRADRHWGLGGLEARMLAWLAVITASAKQAAESLNQLELARQLAVKGAGDRRSHSRLGDLIELLLERPVVTAPMAAERLKISGQSARRLITQLGGAVTEVSGQARYRAWRL
jgi:hypothetical protein